MGDIKGDKSQPGHLPHSRSVGAVAQARGHPPHCSQLAVQARENRRRSAARPITEPANIITVLPESGTLLPEYVRNPRLYPESTSS